MASTGSVPLWSRLPSSLAGSLWAAMRKLAGRPKATIGALGIFFALAIALLFLADLRARYRAEIDQARHSAQNYAEVLAQHTALTFEAIDRSLREVELIRADLETALAMPGADSAALHRRANEALGQIQKSSLMLVVIRWADRNGNYQAWSDERAPPRLNIADRDHFTVDRDDPTDRYFVSRPFRSVLSDRWLIAVSRRLSDRDGSFAGAAVALIDQSYFIRAYRSIDVGPRGVVAMADYPGHIFARLPPIDPDSVAGIRWPVADHLLTADSGSYELVSPIDQTPRIVGYKSVSVPPLVVLISYHRDDQLASWYQHLYTFGPGALLVISVILLGTGLLMWQTGNLAYKNRILEVTLENMAHGLCMFDGQQRLIVCNARYAKMYGLEPNQIRPGATLRSILEARVAAGSSPAAAQEYIDTRLAEVTRNEPTTS
jgi:PAS domain-containing protein